jgi:hypothetical protein
MLRSHHGSTKSSQNGIQRRSNRIRLSGAHWPPTAPVGFAGRPISAQKLAMSLAVAWLISGQQVGKISVPSDILSNLRDRDPGEQELQLLGGVIGR